MVQRGRPQMERYGISESEQGMLDWTWVEGQLSNARNYWISTVTPDGKPHAAPVWGLWHDGAFYFSTDSVSRKAKNLTANPALAMHLESGDDAVMLEGEAALVTDGDLLDELSRVYNAKYPGYVQDFRNQKEGVVYVLRARKALAWKESDFPNTATRWAFA